MSDFATGWLVMGTSKKRVTRFFEAHELTAFIGPSLRRVVTVFPAFAAIRGAADFEKTAKLLTRELHAFALGFSVGDDGCRLVGWKAGSRLAALDEHATSRTAARTARAQRFVDKLARVLGRKPRKVASVDRSPEDIFAALGFDYGAVAYKSYSTLTSDRFGNVDPNHGITSVYQGKIESYAMGEPLSPARAESHADFESVTTAKQWLALAKTIDVARSGPGVIDQLMAAIRRAPFSENADESATVREAAATLVGRCIDHLDPNERHRALVAILAHLESASHPEQRAAWALALRGRVTEPIRRALRRALAREEDPVAVRRLYEVIANIRHELSDSALFQLTESDVSEERKGAYALLEQSALPSTIDVLRLKLATETDPSARAVLEAVLRSMDV